MVTFFSILFTLAFIGGEVARISFGDVAVTFLDIVVSLIGVTWVIGRIYRKEYGLFQTKIARSLFIFVGIALISLLINSFYLNSFQFFVSFLYLVRWIFYTLLIFITTSLPVKEKKKVKTMMIVSSIGVLIVGYLQYFFYSNLRNLFYLGWDDHLYRMFSSFLDPNFAGCMFVLIFLFFLHQALINKKNERVYFITLTIFSFIAVFLTFSRSAMIMLMVSTGFFLFQEYKRILAVLVILFVALFFSVSDFHVEGKNPFRIVSTSERLLSINEAGSIIQKNPILGVGFNAYRYAQYRYGLRKPSEIVSHADSGTDNSFLFVFATTGIIGLLAYLNIGRNIIVSLKKTKEKQLLLAVIIGISVDSLFINSLFYPFIMGWMWILLGVYSE